VDRFQQIGGIAALIKGGCYVLGFSVFIFFIDAPSFLEPVESLRFLIDNQALVLSTIMAIYLLAGVALLVLVLALHERLRPAMPKTAQTATAFGLIWTGLVLASGMIFIAGSQSAEALFASDPERAATVWLSVNIVHDALGGGIELVGGVWMVLVSWIAIRDGKLPKPLGYLGLLIGIVGILTVAPPLAELAAIFGLGQIAWFLWIGVIMLTRPRA